MNCLENIYQSSICSNVDRAVNNSSSPFVIQPRHSRIVAINIPLTRDGETERFFCASIVVGAAGLYMETIIHRRTQCRYPRHIPFRPHHRVAAYRAFGRSIGFGFRRAALAIPCYCWRIAKLPGSSLTMRPRKYFISDGLAFVRQWIAVDVI